MENQTSYSRWHNNFNFFIIFLVALLSIRFYSLFVTVNLGKALIIISTIITLFFYLIYRVYDKGGDFKKTFSFPVILVFISLIISTVAADYFYDQSILSTLLSQNDLYLFLFYILLHKFKPKPEALINMIITLGLIYCLIYIIQYVIYPKHILTCFINRERGTLRIYMPGIDYMVTTFYIILSVFIIKNKPKFLLPLIPIIVVLFLMGTRQAIGIVALMTILMILFSKKVKSKFLIFTLIVICVIPIFFIFQNIFYNMFKLTMEQSAHSQDYIRVRATQYFLFNFNHNQFWMLVGNGNPAGSSNYSIAIQRLAKASGFYLNDIGLIGDFFRFGILYVLVFLYILIQLVRIKLGEKYSFVRYYALTYILTIFVGAGMNAQALVLLCICMYVADVGKKEIALNKMSVEDQTIELKD